MGTEKQHRDERESFRMSKTALYKETIKKGPLSQKSYKSIEY